MSNFNEHFKRHSSFGSMAEDYETLHKLKKAIEEAPDSFFASTVAPSPSHNIRVNLKGHRVSSAWTLLKCAIQILFTNKTSILIKERS